MILTCPECATRYFIDDGSIGEAGRTVRCSSCGASWLAQPEPEPSPLELVPVAHSAEAAPPTPTPEPPLSALPAEQIPQLFRAKADERRRIRQAATTGAIWAGVAALAALACALVVVFRTDVVRAWPKSASAYALAGLPVNTTGITIEGVDAQPGLQDGRAAVVVTGALRNIEDHGVVSPALRINLVNSAGKTVQAKIASPADPMIPPREIRHFTISLLDPPSSATSVEVLFEAPRAAQPKPQHHAAPPRRLRPPPPPASPVKVEDAKPLTGDAPFALPTAAAPASVPPLAPPLTPAPAKPAPHG